MNGNSWPIDAPSPTENEYLCIYLQGFDKEKATAQFERRFGYLPKYTIANYYGYAWLGPIVKIDEANSA